MHKKALLGKTPVIVYQNNSRYPISILLRRIIGQKICEGKSFFLQWFAHLGQPKHNGVDLDLKTNFS